MSPCRTFALGSTASVVVLALATWLGSAAPAGAWALPVGTTPDTRPAAPHQHTAREAYGVEVNLGGNLLAGNVSSRSLNLGLGLQGRQYPWGAYFDTAGFYSEVGGGQPIARGQASGMVTYAMAPWFNWFAFTTHATDSSTKVGYRATVGAGPCWHNFGKPYIDYGLLSLALAQEAEWAMAPLGSQALATRGQLRTNFVKPINANMTLEFDGFWTPALNDPADYRLYGEGSLRVKLVEEALSLKLALADEFDTRPLGGVGTNNVGVFGTLVFSLGK